MSGQIDGTYTIRSAGASRTVTVRDGVARTTALGLAGGADLAVEGTELVLVLDAADWRHDIPTWRWRADPGPGDDWTRPDFDDAAWRVVPHLHPLITARAAGPSGFRAWVTIPTAFRDRPVSVLLGGLDGQDWSRYTVWLDGSPLDAWSVSGSIREPRRVVLSPGSPAHARLRFDVPMLLAVRAEELTRTHPDLVPGELEHHFFADWLVDQAVVAGSVDRVVDSFRVTDLVAEGDQGLRLELVSADGAFGASVTYRAEGSVVRRSVVVHNRSGAAVTLLDLVLDRWTGVLDARYGGRGQPAVVGGSWFAGVEHPAGVSRVDVGRVDLVQMPGVVVPDGGSFSARTTVLGGESGRPVDEVIRAYVTALRPRPERRIKVYSALGWYDFTNPADPLPELTEDLVEENLAQLAEVRDAGAAFDVLMLDDWWDWADLGRFRPAAFPGGAALTRDRIEAAVLRVGLWWATTRAVWSARDRVGMDGAVANAPDAGAALDLAGGEWRWLEEFTNLMIGERRFCLAAEPYRGHALDALPRMIGETRAALFKLDCAVLHCTASDHGHRAGRHSVEPMADLVEAVVGAARSASPDLRVVLYWGFRSPWWLSLADATFDKGLLMEAATVASAPGRTIRHALSTNVDQAIRHARFIPRRLQDSLGVWVGDVAWCNRSGRDEWAEAFLVDLARGADLVQLWGDLTLFDDADRAFLGEATGWFDRALAAGEEPELVGGDPWRMEPYGYLRPTSGVLTAINPGPVAGSLAGLLLSDAVELYPVPGARVAGGEPLALRPYEVRVVRVGADGGGGVGRPGARATREPWRSELAVVTAGGTGTRTVDLPLDDVANGDEIHLAARLSRDGEWAYDAEPQSLVRISATLDGLAVRADLLPKGRDRNGPGSPWVLVRIPAGAAWRGRSLRVAVDLRLPPGVSVKLTGHIVDAWWRGRRRFRALAD